MRSAKMTFCLAQVSYIAKSYTPEHYGQAIVCHIKIAFYMRFFDYLWKANLARCPPFMRLSKVLTCTCAASNLTSSFFSFFLLSISSLSHRGSWFSLLAFLLAFRVCCTGCGFELIGSGCTACFSLLFLFSDTVSLIVFSAAWGFLLPSFVIPIFSSHSAVNSHLNFYMCSMKRCCAKLTRSCITFLVLFFPYDQICYFLCSLCRDYSSNHFQSASDFFLFCCFKNVLLCSLS